MADCLKLKKSNCKNCYKCIRHCPVKSIRFSGNQAHIVGDECILCGHCVVVCPQNAKEVVDETEKVKVFIQSGVPVIASIAPSFAANYSGVGINGMREALKKLGFADAEETSIGATVVKNEYNRMLRNNEKDVLISSCCHSANLLIQKYFPALLPYLADVYSPMQAHSIDIKEHNPSAKTVFIGPCVAKKDEAAHYKNIVDAVLTFDELSDWLESESVVPERDLDDNEASKARLFPTSGGIIRTMGEAVDGYTYLVVDGAQNCIAALKDIENGNIHKCFIEMSICEGSCIGGPMMDKNINMPIRRYKAINDYAGNADFEVEQPSPDKLTKLFEPIEAIHDKPSEMQIREVLRKMGKTKPEDELNCGSCGYDTCRAKAVAVFRGKAEISMCLPYLKERAESFSDNIVNNTPNGIIVLNEEMEVQQINRAARNIMNIRSNSDVMGQPVVRILDPTDFMTVKQTGRNITDKKVYLAEYHKYVEMTVIYDSDYNVIIGMMKDISDEEDERRKKEEISAKTVEIADKVVDKQMRIVQDIASLLGETAAETKIALTKLKETITDE